VSVVVTVLLLLFAVVAGGVERLAAGPREPRLPDAPAIVVERDGHALRVPGAAGGCVTDASAGVGVCGDPGIGPCGPGTAPRIAGRGPLALRLPYEPDELRVTWGLERRTPSTRALPARRETTVEVPAGAGLSVVAVHRAGDPAGVTLSYALCPA
jgi:hypothetical protein